MLYLKNQKLKTMKSHEISLLNHINFKVNENNWIFSSQSKK